MVGRGVDLLYPKQRASRLYMSIAIFSRPSAALMGKKDNHAQFYWRKLEEKRC